MPTIWHYSKNLCKILFAAVTISLAMADYERLPASGAAEISAGDWSCAWEKHQRWLRTVLFARLRDHHAVEDALQQVALAAARGASTLRDPSKLAPWLYRLAVTEVLQYRRQTSRFRKRIENYAQRITPNEESHDYDPLHWLMAEEQRQLIRQALTQLSGQDAEILLLKYTENWSYRQLSEHLGLSTSAIEARLHRARDRLRQALAKVEVASI